MKKLYLLIIVFIMATCHIEDTSKPVALNSSIGYRISSETASRWMNENSSPKDLYSVSATNLDSLINTSNNFIGITFNYAIDEKSEKHILLKAIGVKDFKYLDANSNTFLEKNVAEIWLQNYSKNNPNKIQYHFFGSKVFDEIQNLSYFRNLRIEPATNDIDLSPQLLLIIQKSNIKNARTLDEDDDVFDASSPCPPCKPPGEE